MSDEIHASKAKILYSFLILFVGILYYFSNPEPQHFYDYTFRVAENILNGKIAFKENQPSWLNEFVPFEGNWYSVFPLGSVLTMLPFAFFKLTGAIEAMPSAFICAVTASTVCLFSLLISDFYEIQLKKKVLVSLGIIFGTWMWTNQTFGGAWQLALGFAVIGELGAIYFTVYKRKPLLAGIFFALAFGNRTEILLTAPIFMYFLLRDPKNDIRGLLDKSDSVDKLVVKAKSKKTRKKEKQLNQKQSFFKKFGREFSEIKAKISANPNSAILALAKFCAIPFILGISTLCYNYARFHSFTDFGYARIPGVLDEPWYNHGIFSIRYIPNQAWEMLFKMWETRPSFPYYRPDGFSSSILFSSPFLFLLFRSASRDKILKYFSWFAIILLTSVLWMHGNSGGWQFGYRYAMVLLPWIFILLLESSAQNITAAEKLLFSISFLLNAFAVYLFHWTDYMKQ